MAEEYGVFSRDEAAELRRLLHKVRTQQGNPVQRPPTLEFPQNDQVPVIYIAKTPADGIAGYTLEDTDSGQVPVLNYAECEVWRIPDDGQLEQVLNFSKRVYSSYDFNIPGDTWIKIEKEAYGKWVAEWFDQSEGTGTGTGTSECQDIVLYERKIECEAIGTSETDGEEKEYVREVRVNINEDGCLQKTTGAWEFIRIISCCDPSCATDVGTGTGEGETIPDVCDPCNPKPVQMTVNLGTVTDKNCTDCEAIGNTVYTLTHSDFIPDDGCYWLYDVPDGDPCDVGQGWPIDLSIDVSGMGTLRLTGLETATTYEKEDWDCHAAAVFTKVSEGTACNMPSTVTVTPV